MSWLRIMSNKKKACERNYISGLLLIYLQTDTRSDFGAAA
jgi:hypothetical protein